MPGVVKTRFIFNPLRGRLPPRATTPPTVSVMTSPSRGSLEPTVGPLSSRRKTPGAGETPFRGGFRLCRSSVA
ncbi:hypothetical protein Ssi02_19560 [Sinosporangium siamense]|uniref:Uncharacterized protein n=1 Tax=Sinosporangium siamense TaxID=1367973 RepID=A0A919V493_9ACTN|nr:hypothetical protein Ssi02_19560 [Sinosporangium siamense]